jgi:hypothetical protein
MFSGFISDARESAKISRLTEAAIASTGGAAGVTSKQVGDLATAISNKTGADDEAVQSGANLLLTFTKVRNETGKGNDVFNQATLAATDMAAALGTDTKAAALQLGKALNDPIKGVGALSRAGVSFTAQQKEQIRTLVESGDTLNAQKIILGELGTQFGGAAKAAADPLSRLKVTAGNLGETLGTKLLPHIDKGALFLTDFSSALFDNSTRGEAMTTTAGRLAVKVKEFGSFIGTEVLPRLKSFGGFLASDVLPRLQSLGEFVKRNLDFFVPFVAVVGTAIAGFKVYALVTRTAAATQALLNTVMAANPLGLVVIALAAVAAGLVFAYKRSERFRDIVDGAFKTVAAGGKWMWETVLRPAFDGIKTAFGAVGIAATFMWDKVLKPTFRFLAETWVTVAGAILRGAETAFGWVPGLGGKLRDASAKFETFKDDVNRSLGNLKDKSLTITAYTGVSNLGAGAAAARTLSTRRARGGAIHGPGTATSDSIPAWLSNGEHVWTAREVANLGGHAAMEQLRGLVRQGRVPAFAAGGGVGVDARVPRARDIVDPTERWVEKVARAHFAAAQKAANEMGGAGGAGMGYRRQMALLRSAFPGLALISGFRPGAITATGNRSYHAQGRAVDVPPSMAVFDWIRSRFGRSTRELIFSPAGGRQVWNGRPHMYTGVTRANHWDHVHWAMADGGVINEPVLGRGVRSGKSYAFGEKGPETVLPGVHAPGATGRVVDLLEELVESNRRLEAKIASLPGQYRLNDRTR